MIPESIRTRALFPRSVLPAILPWLDDPQALVLIGSRQVGKTCLLYLLIQHLLAQEVPPTNLFYFDLEHLDHLNLLNDGPEALIQSLRLEGADFEERIYLFIDEIQYLNQPTQLLKLLVDHHPNVKIICTGSSTLDIRRKFKDALVGRKILFEVFSLSFEEFLQFKNQTTLHQVLESYKLSILLQEDQLPPSLPDLYIHPLQKLLDEYCRYGGYPAIALEANLEKKLILLNEIFSAYVHKDIASLFAIENTHAFNQLVQLLALEIGQLLNGNTLTTDLAISRPTLEKYLTILENTFIIKRVRPFFRRKKREVIKMPKLFFFDLGLRNLVVKQFGELGMRPDRGALIENFAFIHLYRGLRALDDLHFWRTKNGAEVNFIVQTGETLLPVEVKYQALKRMSVPTGMQSFLSIYPSAQAAVITRDAYGQKHHHNTKVIFLPAWLLGSFG